MRDFIFRLYQYQTDCLKHIPGEPKAGEWMLQVLVNGQWRNINGPWATKEIADVNSF